MAIQATGSISGLYQYTVGVNTSVPGYVGLTTLDLDQSNVTAQFGIDGFGNPTITVGTAATQQLTSVGGSQSSSAFTYVSGGTTYLLSNGPIQLTNVAVTVNNLHVLLGLLDTSTGMTDGAETYVACYLAGTLILTEQGEAPVESLAIGDRLVTESGACRKIKWIGTRSYDLTAVQVGKNALTPIRIKRGALADDVPRRDLLVSPRHALFIEGALYPAGLLVNGTSIAVADITDTIAYFHVELDSHDVIWAEGAASETFIDDNSRAMFQNAADYRARFPEAPARQAAYYAPRIETGYMLETLLQRFAARGRLLQDDGTAQSLGPLQGSFDELTASVIRGWARNMEAPERPVDIVILDNGVVIAELSAAHYRPDLRAAGLGEGLHAFSVTIPAQLSGFSRHVISIRRKADGAELPGSPMVLEAASASFRRKAA